MLDFFSERRDCISFIGVEDGITLCEIARGRKGRESLSREGYERRDGNNVHGRRSGGRTREREE